MGPPPEGGAVAEFSWTSDDLLAPVELRLGDVGRVRLAERPSTGYRWECTTDAPGVATCRVARPEAERGGPPGGERPVELVITPVSAGVARVTCTLRRPWQDDAASSLGIDLRVTDGGG